MNYADPQPLSGERFPLCAGQQAVWTAQQLDPSSPRYNCATYVQLDGEIEEDVLARAVSLALDEAQALRVQVVDREQVVGTLSDPALETIDLRSGADPSKAAATLMRADLERRLDLETDALVRHVLIRTGDQSRLLYLRHHHVVLDGFGQSLHLQRIAEIYGALLAGNRPPPSRAGSLAAIVREEQEYLASDARVRDRDHWMRRLAGRPTAVSLSGREIGAGAAAGVLRRSVRLGAELTTGLGALAGRLDTTVPALIVAAVAAYTARVTERPDVLLDLPVSARRTRTARHTPCMLSNQLPLLVDVAAGEAFADLVARVTARMAEDLRCQRYRGEGLQAGLGLTWGHARLGTPTVNVATFGAALRFGDVRGITHFLSAGPVRDLALNVLIEPDGGDAVLIAEGNADLYSTEALAALTGHLTTLLGDAVQRPQAPVDRLRLLSDGQRAAVLAAGMGPERHYGPDATLCDLVLAQAARTPHAVAAEVDGESLSYRALVARAGHFADRLRAAGAGPNRVVGVHGERSLDLVVALLGVLMSGAAYLPLDPDLPDQRLSFQIEEAGVCIVVSRRDLTARLPALSVPVLAVDAPPGDAPPADAPAGDAAVIDPTGGAAGPDDIAYVIFTSGSTGRPKGVAVPHRGVVNRLLWMQEEYGLTPDDRVLQKTPFTFDVSVWEFFWPLITGARLHLPAPGHHRDPRAMADAIRRHGITTLHFVPTMLDLFLAEPSARNLSTLKRVFASGEALNPETVGRFFARYGAKVELHNLYGPTEASIDVTHHRCRPGDADGVVPIGRAVSNTAIHVLDAHLEPVPFGLPGELFIGGVQLAAGYVNRPDLTDERFIANPHGPGRLYRTGDIATLRPDGACEYLGRRDGQIKIRGFRVELGEIEAVLLSSAAVTQAVVVADMRSGGGLRLCAHVVPAQDGLDRDALLHELRSRLPDYMVPSQIVVAQSLPTLSSGKIDRNALPTPDDSDLPSPAGAAPAADGALTEAESLVHEIWRRILELPEIDPDASFFALGGNSIMSIRMRTLLEDRGFTVSIEDLFAEPSVRGLAKRLRPVGPDAIRQDVRRFDLVSTGDRSRMPDGVEDAYPLSSLQAGILFHADFEEGTSVYRVVTSVHVALTLDESAMRRALAEVLHRHPALRTSIHLSGFEQPLQLVHRDVPVPLTVSNELLGRTPAEQDALLEAWGEAAKHHVFDLTAAPLVAFAVHARDDRSFQLGAIEHHVVLDGWSDMVMFREILECYEAALAGEDLWLPPVASSFHGFIAAEQRAVQAGGHRDFWLGETAGVQPSRLPSRSSIRRKAASCHRKFRVEVAPETVSRIAALARRAGLPLKSLLGAVHVGVLDAVCDGEEVVTGIVSHARLAENGGDRVIGLFLNTLPLRIDVGRSSWLELARKVHEHESRTAPHRAYPYGRMVRDNPGLALDSYLNFMDFHSGAGKPAAVVGGFGIAETEFALAVDFMIDPVRGRLEAWLDCDLSVLEPAFCDRLAGYFSRALATVAEAPEARPSETDLRSPEEQARLRAWNDTLRDYDTDATIHGLIGERCRVMPEVVAVRDVRSHLTYADLDRRSLQLARFLEEHGAGRGRRVGINLRRGVDLVVALVAVLRTGAAYVPLDPDFPQERLRYIAADAQLDVLLTDDADTPCEAGARISPVQDAVAIAGMPVLPLDPGSQAADIAYLIYTSGSTGQPKGTEVRHRNAVNFFVGMDDRIGVAVGDTVLALTSISFDISILELLWPLTRGATVFVGPERMIERLSPTAEDISFDRLVALAAPALFQSTPSFMAAVATEPAAIASLHGLRALLVGGEALPAGLARQLVTCLPDTGVFNMYGPTETTIWSSVHRLQPSRDLEVDTIPIGRPIANTTFEIRSPHGTARPVGTPGELWIGGDGVAAGYRGRPDLTADRFVADTAGAVSYRTGDRARFLDDGTVEFLGRVDRQVKIAGHRIELDELESILSRHPAVGAVAVVATGKADGASELIAYVAPSRDPAAQGLQETHVDQWRQIWDDAYAGVTDRDAPSDELPDARDFAGWLSSYTGEPIALDEMREWLLRTVDRCTALGARRVVDVGVGVGLFARRLAAQAESYIGFDLSDNAIAAARQAVAGSGAAVRFERGDALALAGLPDASADLVILNSVIQYFPGADYLTRVLREAVRVAGPHGAVFVGDVRDHALLDAFHAHVQLLSTQALASAAEVAEAAARSGREENELCLSPSFFHGFAAGEPLVGEIVVELKRGRFDNELSRFRYDVTLLGAKRPRPAHGTLCRIPWTEGTTLADVAGQVARLPGGVTPVLTDIPDRRLVEPLAALALIREEPAAGTFAWDLQRRLWECEPDRAVDPEDVAVLADSLGRTASLTRAVSAAPGIFDAILAGKDHQQ